MGIDPTANVIDLAPGIRVPQSVLDFQFVRSSGPGGQNVNKLNTKAVLAVDLAQLAEHVPDRVMRRLRHVADQRVTDDDRLVLSCDESRSQLANRKACLQKLRQLLIEATHRPKPRRPTRPTRASRERRLEQKKQRGQTKRLRKPPNRPPS